MATDDYGDDSTIKEFLSIPQENTKYDADIQNARKAGARYVADLLYTISSTVIAATNLTGTQKESADLVANYHACGFFKTLRHAPREIIESWRKMRDEAANVLIAKLKAQPETNTGADLVVVTSDYQSSELA